MKIENFKNLEKINLDISVDSVEIDARLKGLK